MTISELGSLGEVVGAFGLIVTLVFLSMEMRLARQAEESRDLEQVQIRVQELNLAVATSPSLSAIMAKWNKLTGGHFQPLPHDVTESRILEGTDKLTVQDLKIFCLSASISPPPFPKTQRHAA